MPGIEDIIPRRKPTSQKQQALDLANVELSAEVAPYIEDTGIARLGFDPSRLHMLDPDMYLGYGNQAIGGLYSPTELSTLFSGTHNLLEEQGRSDLMPADFMIAAQKDAPSTIRHESTHRGLQLLRGKGYSVDRRLREAELSEEDFTRTIDWIYGNEEEKKEAARWVRGGTGKLERASKNKGVQELISKAREELKKQGREAPVQKFKKLPERRNPLLDFIGGS
jgi:hypothetical protein